MSRLVNGSLSESLILGLLKQRVSTFFAIFGHGSTDIANVLSVYDEEGVTRTINRFNPDDPRVPPAIGNGLERHAALECTRKSILGSPSMDQKFDRAAEDLGNSIHLEHVNVQVPDQRLATLFYATGLGLTRDPYLMVSDSNMWINVGRSQFHLPSGAAQVLRGYTGIVMPGREALLDRLTSVASKLDGTAFAFSEHNDYVEATCPWGNRVRCHEPDAARFGRITLGIPYVEFDAPVGTAKAISAFYREIMGIPAELKNGDGTVARVKMGKDQYLQFRETDRPQPDYDGHHVQMYITDFSGPYRRLSKRGLVSQEDNQFQYRFRDIVDPANGRHLFTVEHEVRSATHPMYLRPLINRNPTQTNRNYANGHDQWPWAMNPDEYDRR